MCNAWQRSKTKHLHRVSENLGAILNRLWTKVQEIFRRCRTPLVFSKALVRLSMSRFTQKIFAIKSQSRRETEQMYTFLAQIFGRDGPDFSTADVSAIYYSSFAKVWLSFQSSCHFLRRCRRLLVVAKNLTDCLWHVSLRRYRPLKLQVVNSSKKVVWGSRFSGEGITPDFRHTFSNRSHFRACGQFWLSSVQRARRVDDEKKDRIVVKPKSADNYVGRPNKESK